MAEAHAQQRQLLQELETAAGKAGAANPLMQKPPDDNNIREFDMGFEADSDDEVAAGPSLTPSRIVPPPPSLPLIEESEFRAQSRVQYKNYKKACRSLDWRNLFPNLLHAEANPPHCLALWKADLSGVFNTLREMSKKNEFGYFLDLALYSKHAISAPAASSFCERVNSHGKLVMTERSTKMKPAKVEERVLLRMNRHFMEHMRRWYPDVTSSHLHLLLAANNALVDADVE